MQLLDLFAYSPFTCSLCFSQEAVTFFVSPEQ